MRRPIDAAIIFLALGLLATMVIDLLTPKELTPRMIAEALAPVMLIGAVLYVLKLPRLDMALLASALWLVVAIVLEIITPKQLSPLIMVAAVAPAILVGIGIHALAWIREKRAKPKSDK